MQALFQVLTPSGRLPPPAFILGAVSIYLAGAVAQLLTVPDVIARAGFWPFALIQAVLVWLWFCLHAKRLHDAGRGGALAAGAAVLYALAVVLLLIIASAFFGSSAEAMHDANTSSAFGLILFISIIATLAGSSSYDIGWFIVAILIALACVPILLAIGVTLWAATRPSADRQVA